MAHKSYWLYGIFFLLGDVLPLVNSGATHSDETALRTAIGSGYDQDVRPSTPTPINVFYSLRTLKSLDIATQSIETNGWLAMSWDDPRLAWNASDYANITEIDVKWAWRPEFFVANTVDGIFLGGFSNDDTRFRIFNTGTVRWLVPVHLATSCDVNIEMFPFDSQSCFMELMFLGFNGIDIDPNITEEINDGAYVPNAEWKYDGGYISSRSFPVCCPKTNFSWIYIHTSFTRLRPFYVINLIVPAVLLTFCMNLAFLLPTESGERLGYTLTILLAYTVVLTITTDMMPTTSKQTPLINIFLLIFLVLCTVTVFDVVIKVKVFFIQSKPPKWLQRFVINVRPIIFLTCCCKPRNKVSTIERDVKIEDIVGPEKDKMALSETPRSDTDESEEIAWPHFVEMMDRFCFYIYSLITLVILVLFFIMLNNG